MAAANQFVVALDHAIAQISGAPQSWPSYLHGTRACRLRRFPYLVVYVEGVASVQIVAVAHTSRRPNYWKRRLS
jgi:plasmid stabilization system protein ParE